MYLKRKQRSPPPLLSQPGVCGLPAPRRAAPCVRSSLPGDPLLSADLLPDLQPQDLTPCTGDKCRSLPPGSRFLSVYTHNICFSFGGQGAGWKLVPMVTCWGPEVTLGATMCTMKPPTSRSGLCSCTCSFKISFFCCCLYT